MLTVKIECRDCGANGLYQGFAEPEGHAVICITCGGTGCEKISYRPFERRKGKKGIHTVSRSRGSFIGAGVGAVGASISYFEFEAGKMP